MKVPTELCHNKESYSLFSTYINLLIWLVVSSQVVVIEDSDVKDCVVGAQTQVEDGAQTYGLHSKVVFVRRSQRHLRKEDHSEK